MTGLQIGGTVPRGTATESLAGRLRTRTPLTGLFIKMPSPMEVEAAAYAGFDVVVLDHEHGGGDGLELEHHVRAADATGIPALVRVPGIDPAAILGVLDAGATGVVVPHVLDAEGARAAVAAAHYPPRGRRGLALSTRAGRYGNASIQEHVHRAAVETIVVVQIEDREAVPQAADILNVAGVDSVLIGVTDLSVSLGRPGQPGHPDVLRAIEAITESAHAADVSVSVVAGSAQEAETWRSRGATLTLFVASQLIRDVFAAVAQPSQSRAPTARTSLILIPGTLATWDLWSDIAGRVSDVADPRLGRIDLDDTIEGMAETVLASAPDQFALAGHSQGATVALEIAHRAPQRVARLALLNVSAGPPTFEQLTTWEELGVRLDTDGFAAAAAEFAALNVRGSGRRDDALLARLRAMAEEVGREGLFRQLAAQRSRPDLRPHLGKISCPTLVISGAADHVSPPELQRLLADHIPGARHETIPDAGHMTPLESPDRVANLLKEWLTC